MKLWKMKELSKNVELIMKTDVEPDKDVASIQILNAQPNIVNNVEIGQKRSVLTHGETNAVKKLKKNVKTITDQSKFRMLKTNALQRKKRDVRSIGKNQPQERKFGLKIQRLVNGTTPLNVLQLLNTELSKKNILNAPRYHINTAIVSRIPTVVMSHNRSVTMSHTKTVKTTKRKDVSHTRNVKTFQSKNVETNIPRLLDKSLSKYPSEYAVIIAQL